MKRQLPRVVFVIAGAIWISGQLIAQPFNPFNVQSPINTSGPNGQREDIHPSGQLSSHPGITIRIQPKYLITYFPTEDGAVEPVTIKKLQSSKDLSAPEEAAPFMGESFYPHLATLLAHEEVPKSLKRRLGQYREQRDQAAADISSQINKTANLSPEEAKIAWSEFNQTNADAWKKLEREREWLWSRLQHGGVWSPGVEINDILQLANIVRGGGTSIDLTQLRILQYFGPGLSAEQRDLLGQMAIEVSHEANESAFANSLLISAAGDRLPLPNQPSKKLESALADYKMTKAQIQNEILERLWPHVFPSEVEERFVRVARRLQNDQSPKFEKLEQQFEALVLALQEEQSLIAENELQLAGNDSPLDFSTLVALDAPQRRLLAASTGAY